MQRNYRLLSLGITTVLLLFVIIVITRDFEQLPTEGTSLGIDWHNVYNSVRGVTLTYRGDNDYLFNPPWSLLVLMPLGAFTLRSAWGLMSLIDIAVLIASVPRFNQRRLYWLAVILLCSAYPVLRQIADGNLEALEIGGVLLIIYSFRKEHVVGMALGLLLATAKFQEVWLLLIIVGLYMLRDWRRWFPTGLIVGAVVGLSLLWRGADWFYALQKLPYLGQGTLIDMSLISIFGQHNSPLILTAIVWIALLATTLWLVSQDRQPGLSRGKAGFLVCASLILAPYSAGNSFLTAFAIGAIPLLSTLPRIGLLLIGLTDVQYVLPESFRYYLGGFYTLILLCVLWAILGWQIYHRKSGGASDQITGNSATQRAHPITL